MLGISTDQKYSTKRSSKVLTLGLNLNWVFFNMWYFSGDVFHHCPVLHAWLIFFKAINSRYLRSTATEAIYIFTFALTQSDIHIHECLNE